MRLVASLALVSILIAGCADTHEFVRHGTSPANKLDPAASFYISVPNDGIYGAKTYRGSGLMTTQVLLAAFSKRARNVQAERSYQSFDDSLRMAKQAGQTYLVFPTILEWEDRATEWSGIPDRVSIKVEVVQVASGQTVESAIINGKSGLGTFGGDHPQDLLPKPVDDFVSTLF